MNGQSIVVAVLSATLLIACQAARGQQPRTPQQAAIAEIRNKTDVLQQRAAMMQGYENRLSAERDQMAQLEQQKQDGIFSTQKRIANAALGVGKLSNVSREVGAGNPITFETLKEAKEAKDLLSDVGNPWTGIKSDYKKYDAAATKLEQLSAAYRQNAAALAQYGADTDELYARRDALVAEAKAKGYIQNFTPADFRKRDDAGRLGIGESKRLNRADSSVLGSPCLDYNVIGEVAGCRDGSFAAPSAAPPASSPIFPPGSSPAWMSIR